MMTDTFADPFENKVEKIDSNATIDESIYNGKRKVDLDSVTFIRVTKCVEFFFFFFFRKFISF